MRTGICKLTSRRLLWAALCLLVMALAAPVLGQGLSVVPESIDFGSIVEPGAKRMNIEILNSASVATPISWIRFEGAGKDRFSVDRRPFILASGESRSLLVQFLPETSGIFSATLILGNSDQEIVVPLTGKAFDPYTYYTTSHWTVMSNVRLGTQGSVANLNPGASTSLLFNYHSWSRTGCPGCIIYIAAGVEADGQGTQSVGIPGRYPGRTGSGSIGLQAPSSLGVYTVYGKHEPAYTSGSAVADYESTFYNPAWNYSFMPVAMIAVVDQNAPAVPTGLVAQVSANTIGLSWDIRPVDGLSQYHIYRGILPFALSLVDSVDASTTNYLDSDVRPEMQYYYRVRAVDTLGRESGFSGAVDPATGPQGVLIKCPEGPLNASVCTLSNDLCVDLQIDGSISVAFDSAYFDGAPIDVSGFSWNDNSLCFSPDSEGAYNVIVIANGSSGDTATCEMTVNVTQKVPMILSTDRLTYFTYDTSNALPDPQMIRVSSTCPPGSLNWSVTEMPDRDWLTIDKTSGSNPDSVQVSITKMHMTPGIYTTMLAFTDNSGENQPVYVSLSILVESGIDVGDKVTDPGQSFSVPVNFFTADTLQSFTLPLRIGTTQPGEVKLDSVVVDRQYIDSALIRYVNDTALIVFHPMQPPPLPDSTYELARIYMTTTSSAVNETFLIDTVTTEIDGQTYSYEFVKAGGQTIVPAFNPGIITIGPPQPKSLKLGDVNCPAGDSVGVPVIANGIQNLAGLELNVAFDTTILQVTDQKATSSYFTLTRNVADGVIMLAAANPSHPVTIPDGDTLLTIWFRAIGNPDDTCILNWGSGNNLSDPDSNPIPNVEYFDGMVVVDSSDGKLGGRITYYSDPAYPLAAVTAYLSGAKDDTAMTATSGWYCFTDLTPGVYTVTPANTQDSPGLNIFDVVKLMQYLVGRDALQPYQMVSADVNTPTGDGAVDIADVIAMLRDIVEIAPLPCGPWGYVKSAYAINSDNWHAAPDTITRTMTGPSQLDVHFLGIRMGDVKGDYPQAVVPAPKQNRDVVAEVQFTAETMVAGETNELTIPVSMTSRETVAGIELHLTYDKNQLEYVGVSSEILKGYLANESDGGINIAWADLEPQFAAVHDQVVVNLHFKQRSETVGADALSFEDGLASDANGNAYAVAFSASLAGSGATALPRSFGLEQNHPNPFNPDTRIEFDLPVAAEVRLVVYNVTGQLITTLVDQPLEAGRHSITWRGEDAAGQQVASGIYFYRLQAGQFTASKKMTLLK